MRSLVRFAKRFIAVTALLGLPGLALAQHAAKAHPKNDDGGGSAATVAVDPETRKLRQPTREEVEELLRGMERHLDQSSAGLTAVTRPDGVVLVDLQDRFQSVSVAKVENGRVATRCVSTSGEARAFLDGPASNPQPKPAATPALEEK